MKVRSILAAAVLAVAGTVSHAATVALDTQVTAEAINVIPGQDFQQELLDAGATHLYSGPLTLISDGPVKLIFTLVGAESGFVNTLNVNGSAVLTEFANSTGVNPVIDFLNGSFGNNGNPNTAEVNLFDTDVGGALSFSTSEGLTFDTDDVEFGVFANENELDALTVFWLGLDDNGANIDDNHDDIIVRVEVAPVPLPASGLLLLAGVGGAFGLRRMRRKA